MKDMPFIHLFKTSIGFYFFDVNTDSIVKVTEETYNKLRCYSENETDEDIERLKSFGLLQPNRERMVKHPETDYLPDYFKNSLNSLLLQVTQNCNQRCGYCIYSGGYNNRVHCDKKMDFETAKKGIDMIIQHSKDSEDLYFGFYGGEPLLEKKLIEKCIDYIESNVEGKKVHYNITTNATLLTEDVMELFAKHKVALLVSLDVPLDIHNRNRGFANGEGDPHSIIMKNLKKFKQKFPGYFNEYVSFNTVLNGLDSYNQIDSFFGGNDLFEENTFMSTLISDNYSKGESAVSDRFIEEEKYASFLQWLAHLGRLKNFKSKLSGMKFQRVDSLRKDKQYGDQIELPYCSHHNGNCVPGIHKVFMSVAGDFYPCEKVSECSKACKMGNIESGFDMEKIQGLLNIELLTKQECHECWAYEYCTLCLLEADGVEQLSRELILEKCQDIRAETESLFKDYCLCKELEEREKQEMCQV